MVIKLSGGTTTFLTTNNRKQMSFSHFHSCSTVYGQKQPALSDQTGFLCLWHYSYYLCPHKLQPLPWWG